MIQCRLCGCKFDETQVKPCGCNCAFGGCNGDNVRCPNCGHDIPLPRELKNNIKESREISFIDKIKKSFKQDN